jgi:hypothetical protein
MNSKHRKTLEALFADPLNGALEWAIIEGLLLSLGCNVIEGSGSSLTFEKDGKRAHFHRPHPQRKAMRYRVRAVRDYLANLGVKP